MIDEIDRRWGGTDVLVHSASTPFVITSFAELSGEQLGGKLDSELRAAFLPTKAVVPGMVSRGYGRLIYRSTGLSRRARDGMITLGTAKAALDQFVRYVDLELAPHGITANLVAPTTVEGTGVTEQFTAERMRELTAATPMRRLVRPEDRRIHEELIAYVADDAEALSGVASGRLAVGAALMPSRLFRSEPWSFSARERVITRNPPLPCSGVMAVMFDANRCGKSTLDAARTHITLRMTSAIPEKA